MELYLTRGKILRYGYVKDNELSESKYAVAFNYALDKNQDLKKKLKILMGEKDRYNIKYNSSKYMEIEEEIKSIRTTIKEQEQYFAEKAQILATTISKVTIDKIFEDKKYDVVMFDEVSMAYVPQLVCAAMYAKEHFIAVGDFRQLAPISQSDAKNILSEDIFSYLKISSGDNNINNHKWLVMLDEQRRMNPEISYFPSKYIYNGLLKDHKSIKESYRNKIQNDIVNLINLSGTYCSSGKNNDNSRFNILSAIVCFATAIKFEKSGEDSIGIISPYVAQTRLIRAMIQDYDKELNTHIVCSTVHQFQGSERNIIIFDGVESYPSKKTGWLMSRNENGSVTRLINVAITRAKNKLITIANLGYWFNETICGIYLKKETFINTFNQVNRHFEEIFTDLTDGEGKLVLENPENPYLGGLTVEGQQKDKKKQKLAGMSGGEKTLMALSLVFAVQRYLPAPFYALDEVDAALDGFNVERIARMITKQSEKTQFVVISQRSQMIESAERMIGVTQKDKGVTKISGVKLNNAREAALAG